MLDRINYINNYNLSTVLYQPSKSLKIVFVSNKHTKIIYIGRHFGCAKLQLEKSLRIFPSVQRKVLQMNVKFAFVYEYKRTFRFTDRDPDLSSAVKKRLKALYIR